MDVLTVDFETYYDQEYSLAKMTMVEYIMDARFQPIMMSYCVNDGDIKNAIGYKQIKDVLSSINWGNTILNAQNCKFDATIIALRFGFFARFYTDTMAMARVTGAHVFEGASLDAIAKVLNANGYPVPPKGKAVATAKGKHLHGIYTNMPYLSENTEFDIDTIREAHELLMAYVEYCNNDVLLARQAFMYFGNLITPDEMQYGDVILKCYIQPSMYLDLGIIKAEIERIKQRDYEKAKYIADRFFNGNQAALRSVCRSAPKFTKFLKSLGGYLPYEEDNGGQKLFEIPYSYSEKKGINAPCFSRTHVPMIEMCERDDYIGDIFRCKLDLTSSIELSRAQRFEAIAKLNVGFGMPYEVSGAHTHRLGGCLAEYSRVIVRTEKGVVKEKYIYQVSKKDLVWDGVEFVSHSGVVNSGIRQCLMYRRNVPGETNKYEEQLVATQDHLMLVNGEWMPLRDIIRSKLRIDKADIPDYAEIGYIKLDKYSKGGNYHVVYDISNCGPRNRFVANGYIVHNSGGLNVQNLSSGRKEGQSNALKRSITAPDGHVIFVADSSQIELRVGAFIANDFNTLNIFKEGKDPYSVQASLIYGGDPDEIKRLAEDEVKPYSNIQRPAGKSSLLSCIYGTGAGGFQAYAKLMGVDLSEDEALRIVQVYRETHPEVVSAWNDCKRALNDMLGGGTGYFGGPTGRLFYYDGSRINHGVRMPGIKLPDGNWLNYHALSLREREMPDGSVSMNFAYRGLKEGRIQWIYTYPARIFENITQALAFAVMKYQAMLINRRYKIVLNTHDEWGIVIPEQELEIAKEYMMWCMRQVPEWAKGLPVNCKGDSAKHYGDCK